MSTAFPTIESFEKRLEESVIKFDDKDPIRDLFVGIAAAHDDIDEDVIQLVVEALNPFKAKGDDLAKLAKKVKALPQVGESDISLRKRVLEALPAHILSGVEEGIILIVEAMTGLPPLIERITDTGFLVESEEFFIDVQDQQDNGQASQVEDETFFADTQDHQDNSTSTAVVNDENTIELFFLRVTIFDDGTKEFNRAGLSQFLRKIKSLRDILEIVFSAADIPLTFDSDKTYVDGDTALESEKWEVHIG